MSLSDIMGHMDLSVYPQVGLIIFLAIFAGMMIRTFSRARRQEYVRLGSMAIEDPRKACTPRVERSVPRTTEGRKSS